MGDVSFKIHNCRPLHNVQRIKNTLLKCKLTGIWKLKRKFCRNVLREKNTKRECEKAYQGRVCFSTLQLGLRRGKMRIMDDKKGKIRKRIHFEVYSIPYIYAYILPHCHCQRWCTRYRFPDYAACKMLELHVVIAPHLRLFLNVTKIIASPVEKSATCSSGAFTSNAVLNLSPYISGTLCDSSWSVKRCKPVSLWRHQGSWNSE